MMIDPRQDDGVPAPAEEVEVRVLENMHDGSDRSAPRRSALRPASSSSKSVFDTKIDVNRFGHQTESQRDREPANRARAEAGRGTPPRSAPRCAVSTSVQNTRLKPALIDARDAARRLELFLDALEDQHVRVHADAHRQHEARDAGQRHRPRRCTPSAPSRITRLKIERDDRR